MLVFAKENVDRSFQAILNADPVIFKQAEDVENTIDTMNKEISQYISKILVHNRSNENVAAIEEYFLITGNAERIGDHALNICGYTDVIRRNAISFSDAARQEIQEMREIAQKAIDKIIHRGTDMTAFLSEIAAFEQQMDDMTMNYREKHLQRMHQGLCSEEACILYSEMLTDFERIGDHVLNIAQSYTKISAAD